MSPVLDTTFVPPRDRAETFRHAVWESVVPVDIDHHLPAEDLSVHIGLGSVGTIRICSARATALTVERTERLARLDEEPAVFLGLQVTGTSLVVQNGRQSVLHPGDFALYETTKPYTLLFDEGVAHHFLRFPRSALALPERSLRAVAAVRLGADNPVAGLASTYFSQLATDVHLRGHLHADAVVEPSLELIRAVVTSQLGDTDTARAPLESTLSLRITQYMRAHLAEPDLSATRIAAAHGISVRHLYTVLGRSNIRLGEWMRSHRLAECRRELAGPHGHLRTIAATGRRWGFVDASHFSKVFKQAYGISPRDWRDLNRPRPTA
ncbi:helix-turn-helix domain-containing protein [Streptomyces fimicarius]|uniref:AraC-like ligand-binding domain-containing protein n=1 Tax=Streptomyces TaxID=1883 RepID=UPI001C4F34EB|nr:MULTISPECIES: helix-turn-helix domain-containing protein [Streptomyces]MCX4712378.1 helix-turn-helix domain-containing protein [Streptomyces griseus]QXR00068.1 helix-turn-helix domain-containing protein [Streptomyces sp. WY228]